MSSNRRSLLATGTALATVGLSGCATVRKELGLVNEHEVIRKRGYLYKHGLQPSDPDAPERERGIWIEFENEHDRFVVAEAVYGFTAETDAGVVVEDEQRVEDFAPGDTKDWYYDLSEETSENVTSYGWSTETFELR